MTTIVIPAAGHHFTDGFTNLWTDFANVGADVIPDGVIVASVTVEDQGSNKVLTVSVDGTTVGSDSTTPDAVMSVVIPGADLALLRAASTRLGVEESPLVPADPGSGYDAQLRVVYDFPPVGAFSANPTSGLAPLTVNFTDESTGDVLSRAWAVTNPGPPADFSYDVNAIHVFETPGTYTVTETVEYADHYDHPTVEIVVTDPPMTGSESWQTNARPPMAPAKKVNASLRRVAGPPARIRRVR